MGCGNGCGGVGDGEFGEDAALLRGGVVSVAFLVLGEVGVCAEAEESLGDVGGGADLCAEVDDGHGLDGGGGL